MQSTVLRHWRRQHTLSVRVHRYMRRSCLRAQKRCIYQLRQHVVQVQNRRAQWTGVFRCVARSLCAQAFARWAHASRFQLKRERLLRHVLVSTRRTFRYRLMRFGWTHLLNHAQQCTQQSNRRSLILHTAFSSWRVHKSHRRRMVVRLQVRSAERQRSCLVRRAWCRWKILYRRRGSLSCWRSTRPS